MKKSGLSILLLFLVSILSTIACNALADESDIKFEQANLAYSKRQYQESAVLYKDLISKYGYSANLFFNLANSYAQQGMIGKAMVNYHRAHRLSPNDPDITRNMELVSKDAGLFQEEKSFGENLIDYFTFNQWCVIALWGIIIVSAGYGATCFFKLRKRILNLFLLPVGLASILAGTAALISYSSYYDAIVIEPGNLLRIAPFDASETTGSIMEGRQVTILKNHHEFQFIKDKKGQTGWLLKGALEPIIPEVK